MRILGISAFQRDAAAALLVDGELVAATQEERYSKKLRDPDFPKRSIRFCLDHAGLEPRDLDRVVFYQKPLRVFERVLATQLQAFPRTGLLFARSMALWLGDRLWLKNRLVTELGVPADRVVFTHDHEAHAAAAYFGCPAEEAALLVVDDVGEWCATTLGRGAGERVETLRALHHPHSLGLFASAVTQFLGFEPGVEEDRVEALASLGTPRYADELRRLVSADEDGGYRVDTAPFRFAYDTDRLFGRALGELFGDPRHAGDPLRVSMEDARDADLAASLQVVLEERVLALAAKLHELVPARSLCFGGEVARNRRLCARLLAEGPFDELFVAHEPGGAGAALGAALLVHHREGGTAFRANGSARLGEALDERAEEGARTLGGADAVRAALLERLVAGKPVAWARGALDFGTRSLGARSVLGDARGADARERLLAAVQQADAHQPCRVLVPLEHAGEHFDVPRGADEALLRAQLLLPASERTKDHAPSAVLACGRAWPQAVSVARDPELHALLREVGARTGAPLLLHTDLHLRGAPLVRNEADAVEAFHRSGLDSLFVEDRIYES